ncbi:hypothetical protein NM208_g10637 [Fusarium decemcellulare]|uniref:Uncharacterized protein n=1 Tax=Fusarium decemcellulare TaxID=57161 RepID=A0ACC1RX70_9HYPO|nr:hypothetical protein NM208_g10637 [Fusarium decemcellulare]
MPLNVVYTWICSNCGCDAGTVAINASCPFCDHKRCTLDTRLQHSEARAATIDDRGPEELYNPTTTSKDLSEPSVDPLVEPGEDRKTAILVGNMMSQNDSINNGAGTDQLSQPLLEESPSGSSLTGQSARGTRENEMTSTSVDVSVQQDPTNVGTCAPTKSEEDSSTGSPESENSVDTPGATNEMGRLHIDTSEDDSSSTCTLDTSSSADNMESSEDDLLERPWFHQHARRILRSLLQQWPGFRNRTQGHFPGTSQSPRQQQQPSSQRQGSDGRRKRKQKAQKEEEADEEQGSKKSKRGKPSEESEYSQGFACPFPKNNLQQYRSCALYSDTSIKRVNQHVKRSHKNHMDNATKSRVEKTLTRGKTGKEKWYEIFGRLFPGAPEPESAYNDFILSAHPQSQDSRDGIPLDEGLYLPREYLTGEGAQVLQQELVQDPVFQGLSSDAIRAAVTRGLARLLDNLDRRQRQFIPIHSPQTTPRHASGVENGDFDREQSNHQPDPQLHLPDDNSGANDEHASNHVHTTPANLSLALNAGNFGDSGGNESNGDDVSFQNHSTSLLFDEQLNGQWNETGLDGPAIVEQTPWDSQFWIPDSEFEGSWEYVGDSEILPSNEHHDS